MNKEGQLYRDKKWIVAPLEGARFPERCVKSNQPVDQADYIVTMDLLRKQIIVPKTGTERAAVLLVNAVAGYGYGQILRKSGFHFMLGLMRRFKTVFDG